MRPQELCAGFPFKTNRLDGLAEARAHPGHRRVYLRRAGLPARATIDPDLAREAVRRTRPRSATSTATASPRSSLTTWPGTIYVIDAAGPALKSGWPKRLPYVPSCSLDPSAPTPAAVHGPRRYRIARGAFASPVLADMDKDGKLDIIQAAFDGNVYVFDAQGNARSTAGPSRCTTRETRRSPIATAS
jgi:hypothetical protein